MAKNTLQGDPVRHDLGGGKGHLAREYATHLINIYKNGDTYNRIYYSLEYLLCFTLLNKLLNLKIETPCI